MEYYVFIMYIMSKPVINRNALMSTRQIKAAANNGANKTSQSDAPESPENVMTLRNKVAAETAADMNNGANQTSQSDAPESLENAMTLRDEVAADDDEYEYSGDPKINNLEYGLRKIELQSSLAVGRISKLNENIEKLKENTVTFREMFNSQFRKDSESEGGTRKRSSIVSRKRSGKYKFYKRKITMKQKSKRRRSSRR